MKNLYSNPVRFLTCIMLIGLGSQQALHAQNNNMGIGTTTPDASAILEIKSNSKGLLIPRLNDGQQSGLSGPAGLLIYNTDQNRFNYYQGGWKGLNLWRANGLKAYYNDGNVGIGTTDPLSKLSISPNTTEAKITLWDGGGGTDHYGFGVSGGQLNYHVIGAASSHVFYNGGKNGNGTEILRIKGDGLNVSTSIRTNLHMLINHSSPTLYFQDTDHRSGMIHQNSDLMHFLSGSGVNSGTWTLNGSYWPLTLNMNNDEATFGGSAYFMEGNVGIGTNTPTYKLTIAGGDVGLDNGRYMLAKNTSGNYEPFFWPRWTDNIMYMNYGAGGFHIRNNASASAMFMTDGGNIGIGTTTPLRKLHIEGTLGVSGWYMTQNGSNGNAYTFVGPAGGQAAISSTNGAYSNSSDRRLKDNIIPLGTVLPSLMKLEAKKYTFKADPGKEINIGFIAQDVEPLFPEFVMAPAGNDESGSFYKMNYAGFGVIAVKAIQEQQAVIEIQAAKIEAQQAEIDAIKKALVKAGIQLD